MDGDDPNQQQSSHGADENGAKTPETVGKKQNIFDLHSAQWLMSLDEYHLGLLGRIERGHSGHVRGDGELHAPSGLLYVV
jgi:hypothetical protein